MRNPRHPGICERFAYARGEIVVGEFIWTDPPPGRRISRIGPAHLAVIPWRAVRIGQEGSAPFIADPGTVVFYNTAQPYFAEQLDAAGEHSIYFRIAPDDFAATVRRLDPSAADRHPDRPLRLTHARCDLRRFAWHRRLLSLARRRNADPLQTQEFVVTFVSDLLVGAYRDAGFGAPAENGTTALRRQRDAAEAARLFILRNFRQPLALIEIARAANVSSAHLCRIFHRHIGRPVHQYLTDLRLRASLEPLCDTDHPLAMLALDLGFASQAHFTAAFSRQFGCAPGAFRRGARSASSRARS
jgi:AraC-like DNA-binding protein